MKYDYYLFDMDGTLVDTGEGIIASLQKTQEEMGLRCLDRKTLRLFLGPPLKESIMKYYGVTYEETEKITQVYRDWYMKVGVEKSVVFDYVKDFMMEIQKSPAKCAIATLKQYQLASNILEEVGLKQYADYIALNLNNDMGDKAEQIVECLQFLGCTDKSRVVMVGDSPNDAEAANRVGIDFIGLEYGEGFKKPGAVDLYPISYLAKNEKDLYDYIVKSLK